MPGVRLGAYEILRLIGAGGMGEVYKARDTRLDRIVAVKVLPQEFAVDAGRRERFEREARAVAALNHPHICSLHDIGEAAGAHEAWGTNPIRFLVMEHLEGQTLADRLLKGPIPVSDVLRYAVQLADALAHAHRRGLVHRDLKPGNVMLTHEGTKLLDFGLSTVRSTSGVPALSTVSSADAPLTAEGAVIGTYPYMSPEQLASQEVDGRSDIFALGATVYEMATGRRAFQGTTAASLIGAILHTEPPPISSVQPLAPPALDRVVARCMAKDPDDRWQTARDLALELRSISEQRAAPVAFVRRHTRLVLVASTTAIFLAIAAMAWVTAGYPRLRPADGPLVRLAFTPADGPTLADLVVGGPVTIAPDGRRLAFVATGRDGRQLLWVRPLESLSAQALPETDGAAYPFWSPDGQFVGFFAQRKLKKIALSGGSPQILCDAVLPRGGTWNKTGDIVFSAGVGQMYRVSAAGGVASVLPDDGLNQERHWPSFLPDGRHYIYFGRPQKLGIYVDSIDSPRAKLLLSGYVTAAYAPPGYLLGLLGSSRGAPAGTLLAHRFDASRLELIGEPVPVAERIRYESGFARGAFSVSDTGTLVYGTTGSSPTHLMWFDRSGNALGTVGGSEPFGQPSLSPDDKTVAVERVDPITQDQDIWLIDTGRNLPSRFTSHPNNITFMPVWSPDGARILFAWAPGTPPNLYQRASSTAGADELLLRSTSNTQPTDWSRDGRFVVYANLDPKTEWDLWFLPMRASHVDGQPVPFLQTEFNEHLGRLSPDGRWLAYVSDESGTKEVYLRRFPSSDGKTRISLNGGNEPRWDGDGHELFYLSPDGRLMAVTIELGASVQVRSTATLFKTHTGPIRNSGFDVNYTVTRDGQRFLISTATEAASAVSTAILLNWTAMLRQR